jgi:uncharacterized protein YdeI (YjbR/CyaY-like superfamily)
MTAAPKPTFFPAPADLRRWLKKNHAKVAELWVGFPKKGTGRPSITWPESVDEAPQAAEHLERLATWWVISAKQEETRRRRLDRLIARCAAGRRIGP